MKGRTVAEVLAAIGISLTEALAKLEDMAVRNPDARPAVEFLKAILNSAVTAESLATAGIEAPKEILDWLTKPSTDVVGDDSDQA